ncbi:unnamed protein product [Hermetia illucens]|uniref:Uncharacterized protein n=1 Tax=Hermetia illucens TaxID=343691 RepID=A0A7R8UWQ2_HERIL|nr:unnamed protein product [Hermetia illucens]
MGIKVGLEVHLETFTNEIPRQFKLSVEDKMETTSGELMSSRNEIYRIENLSPITPTLDTEEYPFGPSSCFEPSFISATQETIPIDQCVVVLQEYENCEIQFPYLGLYYLWFLVSVEDKLETASEGPMSSRNEIYRIENLSPITPILEEYPSGPSSGFELSFINSSQGIIPIDQCVVVLQEYENCDIQFPYLGLYFMAQGGNPFLVSDKAPSKIAEESIFSQVINASNTIVHTSPLISYVSASPNDWSSGSIQGHAPASCGYEKNGTHIPFSYLELHGSQLYNNYGIYFYEDEELICSPQVGFFPVESELSDLDDIRPDSTELHSRTSAPTKICSEIVDMGNVDDLISQQPTARWYLSPTVETREGAATSIDHDKVYEVINFSSVSSVPSPSVCCYVSLSGTVPSREEYQLPLSWRPLDYYQTLRPSDSPPGEVIMPIREFIIASGSLSWKDGNLIRGRETPPARGPKTPPGSPPSETNKTTTPITSPSELCEEPFLDSSEWSGSGRIRTRALNNSDAEPSQGEYRQPYEPFVQSKAKLIPYQSGPRYPLRYRSIFQRRINAEGLEYSATPLTGRTCNRLNCIRKRIDFDMEEH